MFLLVVNGIFFFLIQIFAFAEFLSSIVCTQQRNFRMLENILCWRWKEEVNVPLKEG